MIFIQHIPNFSDHTPYTIEVDGTKELLEKEVIKCISEDPNFYKFSQGQYWDKKQYENQFSSFHKSMYKGFENGGWHLMAEFKNGKEWWVVGTANEDLGLSKWYPKVLGIFGL